MQTPRNRAQHLLAADKTEPAAIEPPTRLCPLETLPARTHTVSQVGSLLSWSLMDPKYPDQCLAQSVLRKDLWDGGRTANELWLSPERQGCGRSAARKQPAPEAWSPPARCPPTQKRSVSTHRVPDIGGPRRDSHGFPPPGALAGGSPVQGFKVGKPPEAPRPDCVNHPVLPDAVPRFSRRLSVILKSGGPRARLLQTTVHVVFRLPS